ncbi:unnamed protein product, partial [Symbiodinium microadriaticum]
WLLIAPASYRNRLIPGCVGMLGCYGLGFTLLLTRFPECKWPNSFVATHIVASHTLWHIAVAAAAAVWFFTLLDYQAMVQTSGCSPFLDQQLWYAF